MCVRGKVSKPSAQIERGTFFQLFVCNERANGGHQPRRHPLELETTLRVYMIGALSPAARAASAACRVGQRFDRQTPFLKKEYKPSRQNLSWLASSQFGLILVTKCVVSNVS